MKSVSIADAKNRLTELLYEAEEGQTLQLTRRGQPVAVLLSEADYLRLRAAAAGGLNFADWAQQWRTELPAGFEGISAGELDRWREL